MAASSAYQSRSNGVDPPKVGVRFVVPLLPGGLCVPRPKCTFAPQPIYRGGVLGGTRFYYKEGPHSAVCRTEDLLLAGFVST